MNLPRNDVHQLAAQARQSRAAAAALPVGAGRAQQLRQARAHEGLLLSYARAIERGYTAADSLVVASFEGSEVLT